MESLEAGGGRLHFYDIKHIYSAHAGIQYSMNILCEPWCVCTTERNFSVGGVKGKVVPLQARCGPEGSRRFRLPYIHDIRHMTVVRPTHRPPLPPGMFLVLIFTRGWVDPRVMLRSEVNMPLKNPVTPPGIDPGIIRLVAQRLNHYATPGSSVGGVPIIKVKIKVCLLSSSHNSFLTVIKRDLFI
jgi:hypothetical protein